MYDRLFTLNASEPRLRDAIVSGQFFPASLHDVYDPANGMLPGRALAWKYLLLFKTPLATVGSQPPIEQLRQSRRRYVELLKQHLRAPDGSFEEWVEIPGFDPNPADKGSNPADLTRNNPLSLDLDSGWHDWFESIELRKTIRKDVERTFVRPPSCSFFVFLFLFGPTVPRSLALIACLPLPLDSRISRTFATPAFSRF